MDSLSLLQAIAGVRNRFQVSQHRLWLRLGSDLSVPVVDIRRLVEFEAIRDRLLNDIKEYQTVPCKLWLLLQSFCLKPAVQVGGRPFRPKGKHWPTWRSGRKEIPMDFVAQFHFDHSFASHLMLPGDFLLIFLGDQGDLGSDHAAEYFSFEWYQLPFSPDDREFPITWRGHECVGYEGFDVVGQGAADHIHNLMIAEGWRGFPSHWATHVLCFPGIKTGGAPASGSAPESSTLLCSVSQVGAEAGEIYPWADHPEPIETYSDREVDIWDGMALLEFFWNPRIQEMSVKMTIN